MLGGLSFSNSFRIESKLKNFSEKYLILYFDHHKKKKISASCPNALPKTEEVPTMGKYITNILWQWG